MTITLLLLEQIVVLFMMMGLGYLLVKLKLAKSDDSRLLSLLHVYIIGPCVMIKSFQIEFTPDVLKGFLFAVAVAIIINVLLLILVAAVGRALNPREQGCSSWHHRGTARGRCGRYGSDHTQWRARWQLPCECGGSLPDGSASCGHRRCGGW